MASFGVWQRFLRRLRSSDAAEVLLVPPLRARKEDVPLQVARRLEKLGVESEVVTVEFMEEALAHHWPGNTSELDDAVGLCVGQVSSAVGLTGSLLRKALGKPAPNSGDQSTVAYKKKPSEAELRQLVAECGGNISEIARRQDWSRRQIHRWLNEYSIVVPKKGRKRAKRRQRPK